VIAGRATSLLKASHHFKLTDIEEAYAAFGNAGKTGVLKVILQRT